MTSQHRMNALTAKFKAAAEAPTMSEEDETNIKDSVAAEVPNLDPFAKKFGVFVIEEAFKQELRRSTNRGPKASRRNRSDNVAEEEDEPGTEEGNNEDDDENEDIEEVPRSEIKGKLSTRQLFELGIEDLDDVDVALEMLQTPVKKKEYKRITIAPPSRKA